jgi:hypothetical protein
VTVPGKYLLIHVRTSFEGVVFRQIFYQQPWVDVAGTPSKNPATLTDNTGHAYSQKALDSAWKITGRPPAGEMLTSGHQINELLIFAPPTGNVDYLRLKLPAAALGDEGEFRFQIPRGKGEFSF